MQSNKWAWFLVAIILAVPYLLIGAAGFAWLYERNWLWIWFIVGVVCSTLGWFMLRSVRRQNIYKPDRPKDPHAPQVRKDAEAAIDAIAERMQKHPERINSFESLWPALREVMEAVAKVYHPRSSDPVWETPAPHMLRIIEMVARDLRLELDERVPAAHAVTLADVQRLGRLGTLAQQLYNVYRIGSLIFSPHTAIWREARDYISGDSFSVVSNEARRWAIGFAVHRAGEYAIELYSGEMLLEDLDPEERFTSRSRRDEAADRRRVETDMSEPLRMLIIGQTKAGKSSLINALFGKTVAAVGPSPLTDEVTAYQLKREGVLEGLVLDSPGYEVVAQKPQKLKEALLDEIESADIVLLVCSATSAAREADRLMLDALRQRFAASPQRTPPVLQVVLTHIDLLRPRAEWNPPYNVVEPESAKEKTIREAMEAVADDFDLPVEGIVPVCLAAGHEYNVSDGLAVAIAASLDGANRAKYFRCLSDLREEEFWRRMGEQAKASGTLLAKLGARWLGETGRRIDNWTRVVTGR